MSFSFLTGHDPVGLVIAIEEHAGPVQCVCFSVDCYYMLACVGCVGLIYRVKVSGCVHVCECDSA